MRVKGFILLLMFVLMLPSRMIGAGIDDFVTTWRTTTANESITIPTWGTYNYTVDWGDGSTDATVYTGSSSHTYTLVGDYNVTISGVFPRIVFSFSPDKDKVISIIQWGTTQWTSMYRAFYGCSNLHIDALDAPNLSAVTAMNEMFRSASSMNENINHWDVSNVTTMRQMFFGATNFNKDIGDWNVSKVETMQQMFFGATNFNQDISSWDVNKVNSMSHMFYQATNFNQDIGSWDVSNVGYMFQMFYQATSFNQNIGDWNVSNVLQMNSMLIDTNLSTSNYDSLLIGWNAQTLKSNVTFSGGDSNYCLGESARANMISSDSWNISDGGKDCTGAISPTDYFITTWKTTLNGESITIPTIGGGGYSYDVDWGDGSVSIGETGNATHPYAVAGDYTVKISGDFPQIYFNNSGDKDKILSIEQWGTGTWTSMESAFYGCTNLDANASDTPNLTAVEIMDYMFYHATSFDQNISNWDVSNVEGMNSVFAGATSFNQDLSGWNVGNVVQINSIFSGATNFNQDIGDWNVSSVTEMNNMFANAINFNQDISSWDVSSVTKMQWVFNTATSFNQDISSWDVGNVTLMDGMFFHATDFNQSIGDWNVSKVTNMDEMFIGATSFDQNIGGWDVSSVTTMVNMFLDDTLSVQNYDSLLIGWNAQILQNSVTFHGGNSKYCQGTAARENMIVSDDWNITDGGMDSSCNICDIVTDVNKTECEALVALYDDTDGTSWINDGNWTTSTTVGDWYGVVVSGGFVEQLNLNDNNLSGTIPSELGNLSNLTDLHLFNNQLTGSIPTELGNLSNLERLYLHDNQLTGSIPIELGNLSNLERLYLYDNQLTGSIPTELENLLGSLTYLSLRSNQLTGPVPIELGNLSNLIHLQLYNNQLTGSIPSELGNLSNLILLQLHNNQLTGSIPTELGNLSNLTHLQLYNNELTGSIPVELGNLGSLRNLDLDNNELTGSIPTELGNLSNLTHLYFKNNQFIFSDFESEHNNYENNLTVYTYQPQAKVDTERTVGFINGGTLTITPEVPINPSGNDEYKWFKDSVDTGITSRIYTKLNATNADAGVYTYEITNTVVTVLTLESNNITVGLASPIAEYRFDECSWDGTTDEVKDSSGNDFNGTAIDGASTITGKLNTAGDFNGTNFVKIENSAALEVGKNNSDFSLSFWMKLGSGYDGTNYRSIIHKGNIVTQRTFALFMKQNSNRLHYRISTDSSWNEGGDTASEVSVGAWTHIVYVKKEDKLQLYINKVKDSEKTLDGNVASNDGPIYIGDDPWSNGFDGQIDEFKIFDVALGETQIQEIYDNESAQNNYDNTNRDAIICSQAIFNAVNQDGGCFNWSNNITTKIAEENINLTILSADENDNNASLEDTNITKLELLSFQDANCTTLYDTTEIWNNNIEINSSSCFNPPSFTHSKAVKCAKIKITGIFKGAIVESNSTDTFSIRPDEFILDGVPVGKLIAQQKYIFKVKTNTPDYNTSVTPTSKKYFRDDSDGSAMAGDFLPTVDFVFVDGVTVDTNLSFNNVGKIGFELNDTVWAEVDSDDTSLIERTIYLEHNFTFIPDRFDINFTLIPNMSNHGGGIFTYYSNDLNMSANLEDLNFTITALGSEDATMTNYQEPQNQYYANDINITEALTVSDDPNLSAILSTKNDFTAGIATVTYDNVDFNYERNHSKPIDPKSISGGDGEFKIDVIEADADLVFGNTTTNFTGGAEFYFGRLKFEDLKTQDATTSGKAYIEIYSTSILAGFKRNTASWYENKLDSFTPLEIVDFNPRRGMKLNSASAPTNIENLSIFANGTTSFDVITSETDSFKAYYHVDIPSWLWYSRYNDYNFTVSSDCSEHPCFEYIFETMDAGIGIRSGDFNGSEFNNSFDSGIKKKAIKLMR